MKTLVVANTAKSDSEIAIPPVTTVRMDLRGPKKTAGKDGVDLAGWLSREESLNGLQSTNLLPWHIVVTYDQFDEDGDNVHSGVFEEYWVSPKKYKRSYKSDNFNQTDYATDKGLYRRGDQQWPDRVQTQVRAEIVTPFSYAETLQGFHGRNFERSFSGYNFQCVFVERDSGISDPTQYCFEPGSSVLRYSRGFGWFQTVYNRVGAFEGRNLAREVDVTDGGKPYLKLKVETIELLSDVNDGSLLPPSDAIGMQGNRISGVSLQAIDISTPPRWPASLLAQHFMVRLQIVVGKDGHVISAHGISGPPEGYQACIEAVRKWVFKPYLVLDKPVEVEQQVEFSNN